MKRNALKELVAWNESADRKPLIVWGARQVGKTYLVCKLFAERYYKNRFVYVDFRKEKTICEFCNDCVDAEKIVGFIEAEKRVRIDGHTLLVFDEVQECPAIITSLKYFCQDLPHIPVIATGSMVRIRLQRISRQRGSGGNGFLFPIGKIDEINLYPMTFDEFLVNYNPVLKEKIESAYANRIPLDSHFHDLALETLKEYLLVGGMPAAVQKFLDTGSYHAARIVLSHLYNNYLADMELYQASPQAIVRSRNLFSCIYKELNRESKNFSAGLIEANSKTRDFVAPIDWLVTANILLKSNQLKEHVTIPLIQSDESSFRLYLSDIGMFSYQSEVPASSFLSSGENTLSGIFYENYVAEELNARGLKLFYWKGKNNAEFEFVLYSPDHGPVPVDVKKSRGSLNSLQKYRDHNSCDFAVKVSAGNYGYNEENKVLTVPLYAVYLLAEQFKREMW